jgi:hypothetical protein
MFVGEIGILRFELSDLSVGAPLPVTVARVSEVDPGDPIEPATHVEARRDLEGERLVVDEAVFARRSNRLLVERRRIGTRPSSRAISAATRSGRFSKFSGQYWAHTSSCR